MKSLRYWFNAFRELVATKRRTERLQDEVNNLKIAYRELLNKQQKLDKLLAIDVAVSNRGACTVILTGAYRGRGYVQVYDMPREEFEYFVRLTQDMRKQKVIRSVDAPFELEAYYNTLFTL